MNGMNPKCRLCNQYNEIIDHIVCGCPVLAKSGFMQWYEKAASYTHWKTRLIVGYQLIIAKITVDGIKDKLFKSFPKIGKILFIEIL